MPGPLTGKTIAVTGAAGFLGGQLVHRLSREACRIIRVSRSAHLPAAAAIDVIGDLSDRLVWDQVVDADVIFHCAAQTSVAAADRDPEWDFQSNVAPMRVLLDACRQQQKRPVVLFAGTVTEAGIPAHLPVDEDATDDPMTTYDRHTLMAENDLKAAASHGTVSGATLRLANVYGPGAPGRSAERDVLNRTIAAAIQGRPLTVYGTGEYVRDYVFVDDVVDAFLLAAVHAERVNGRHFVIGSGRGTSIREAFALIASRIERLTGRRVPVVTTEPATPLSAIERRNFVADSSRFCAATGWRPSWSLSDGIDRTIEAFTCV